MCTVDVTIGERYTALSANQRAGPGPAPAVLHHPRPMAAPSCSAHRLGSTGHCFIITTTDWRMICSLVLVRVRVREVVRVAAKLPVVPRPGAEAGRGAAAFPPPPPPPAALQ